MFVFYYNEFLNVCVLNLTNLSEWIICEVSLQNSKGNIGIISLQARILLN